MLWRNFAMLHPRNFRLNVEHHYLHRKMTYASVKKYRRNCATSSIATCSKEIRSPKDLLSNKPYVIHACLENSKANVIRHERFRGGILDHLPNAIVKFCNICQITHLRTTYLAKVMYATALMVSCNAWLPK